MTSWIYVFSKFTPEALLFEALLIFVLVASYAAFWVLRKRRLGAVDDLVPSSVVKVYLNELIGEAHDLRTQLFGLLSGNLPVAAEGHGAGPSFQVSGDAALKLSELEKKMADQSSAIEKIMAEKAALEKELADARAKGATAGTGGGEDLQKLQDKCSTLEARLAEYSVIEDDLANLKRLQQENAQLKTQLAQGGGAKTAAAPAAAEPAAAAAPAPAPAPEAPAAAPSLGTSAESAKIANDAKIPDDPLAAAAAAQAATDALFAAAASGGDLAAAPAPSTAEAPAAAAPAASGASGASAGTPAAAENPAAAFEGLVDEVEKSLQPNNPTAGAAAATSAAPAGTPPAAEKTDEDLIAEFEKMLNS